MNAVRLSHPFPSYSELLTWFMKFKRLLRPHYLCLGDIQVTHCFHCYFPASHLQVWGFIKIESLSRHFWSSEYREFRRHGRMFEQRKYNCYPMKIFMPQNPLWANHRLSIDKSSQRGIFNTPNDWSSLLGSSGCFVLRADILSRDQWSVWCSSSWTM